MQRLNIKDVVYDMSRDSFVDTKVSKISLDSVDRVEMVTGTGLLWLVSCEEALIDKL